MTDHPDQTPTPTPSLSDWVQQGAAHAEHEAALFKSNKAVLLKALASAGVTYVVVTFDGYGDSGQIENVEVRSGDDVVAMPPDQIEFAEAVWGQPAPQHASVTIADALERLAYDVLEKTHGGWENNDGAYGDIIFDVAEDAVTLDYNERYTASENHTHHF